MSGRTRARLLALLSGIALGLIVLVVLLAYLADSGDQAGALPDPTPALAQATKPAATATAPVRPTPTATPTVAAVVKAPTAAPTPGRVRLASLAELASRAPSLSGQRIQVALGEQDLTEQAESYLRAQGGADVSNVSVRIRQDRIVLTGTAREGILGVDFTVTGHPSVQNGALKLVVDSVEPSIVSRFSQVGPGTVIDLGQSFEAESVSLSDGQMTVNGIAR